MAVVSKTTVKSYFETGDRPSQDQFVDLIDSYQDFSEAITAIVTAVQGGQTGFVIVEASADATLASAGAFGVTFVGAATTAAAQALIATTIGQDVLQAADSTAAASAIGITTVAQSVVFASTVTAMSSAVLSETGVAAAQYPNATITVDSAGRITAAVSGVGASAATTAAIQSETGDDVFLSPARAHRAPSAVQAWALVSVGSGVPALLDSRNVSGIVDNATGDLTVTWDTDFVNTNYSSTVTIDSSSSAAEGAHATTRIRFGLRAAGSCQYLNITGASPSPADPQRWNIVAIGDLS